MPLAVLRPERGGQTPGAGGKWASTIFGCPGWLARAGRRIKPMTGYTVRRATPQQTPADIATWGRGWGGREFGAVASVAAADAVSSRPVCMAGHP